MNVPAGNCFERRAVPKEVATWGDKNSMQGPLHLDADSFFFFVSVCLQAVQGKLQDELKAAQQEVDDSAAHAAELQSKLGRSEVNRSVLQRKVDERDIDIAEVT